MLYYRPVFSSTSSLIGRVAVQEKCISPTRENSSKLAAQKNSFSSALKSAYTLDRSGTLALSSPELQAMNHFRHRETSFKDGSLKEVLSLKVFQWKSSFSVKTAWKPFVKREPLQKRLRGLEGSLCKNSKSLVVSTLSTRLGAGFTCSSDRLNCQKLRI